MADIEADKKLFTKYPPGVALMVKAVQQAISEGRATIKDGVLVFKDDLASEDKNKSVRGRI